MINDGPDIQLLADGTPLDLGDPPLVGLRLLRRVNQPAELRLRFSLPTPSAICPLSNATKLSLLVDAEVAFDGQLSGFQRSLGTEGNFVDVTAADHLAQLSASWTASPGEITSLHRFLSASARRCGLSFQAIGWSDFPVGRHLNLFETDLEHTVAIAARYGLALSCRGDILIATDLTNADRVADHTLDLRQTVSLSESKTVDPVDPEYGWQGWAADDDRTLSVGDAGTGPRLCGQPIRYSEPPDRLGAAYRTRKQNLNHVISAQVIGLADIWPTQTVIAPFDDAVAGRISRVELLLDGADGARTLVSTAAPETALGMAACPGRADGFFTGLVSATDDPMTAGRVRVSLHGHTAATTGWLPVTGLYSRQAGGTGLTAPMSKGDPVVIAAPQGDPDLGFVLGGLLRGGGPGADRSAAERREQLWAGDGAQIRMDEASRAIHVSLDDGASITLDGGDIHLKAPGNIAFDADGDFSLTCAGDITIGGNRIDFKKV